jgi:RNA polymerase sigma-70 factor (ECF subfamily)
MTESDVSDAEQIARLCRGDPAAAQALYQRHGQTLLRFAVAMVRCRATAEDVVHDSFVELMQRPTGFDPARGNLTGYLLGIARNQVSRVFRLRERTDTVAPDAFGDIESSDEDPAAAQDAMQLRNAILALPHAHREVLVLCDLEELSYAIVADIVQCPIGTVRSRLHRARALLGSRVGPHESANIPPDARPNGCDSRQHLQSVPESSELAFDYRSPQ